MTEPLFDVPDPDPAREVQICSTCDRTAWASDDGLRVRNWLVYDGTSQTGRKITLRMCTQCQREGRARMARRTVGRQVVQPSLPGV